MGFRDFLYNVQNSKLGCKITETKDAVRYSKVGWAVSDAKDKIADATYSAKEAINQKKFEREMRDRNIEKEFISPLATGPVITKARTNLEPGVGSPIYCDLGFNKMEHSGIYVGNNEVVHLNGNGQIEKVSLNGFTSNVTSVLKAIRVPFDKEFGMPISFESSHQRALNSVGKSRDYNLVLDNCHQFTSGCLTGDFESCDNFLTYLKWSTEKSYGGNIRWVDWNWK
ncbi:MULTISPECIES: lecithin retinol acyltransferase family protein [Bacillus]|uniref:lecithin retinol acyltransferase family protein n=1 Tax=Bacillus TaxID=1386 RepID=UPI000B02D1F1|nr:lecithin retinol acyltransferase family protein [Bacillus mobilis]